MGAKTAAPAPGVVWTGKKDTGGVDLLNKN